MNHRFNTIILPALLVLLLAATVVISLFFRAAVGPKGQSLPTPFTYQESPTNPLVTRAVTDAQSRPTPRANEFILGNPDAPVTIYEFSDFSCPYCKLMASLLSDLVQKYPNDVRVIWRDFPITALHPSSPEAHVAARCAGEQGKFWEFHDELFAGAPFERDSYLAIASRLDLNSRTFSGCLSANETQTAILADMEEGDALGIDGTPYLFVGDQRISGLVSAEELEQVVALHKQLQAAP